MVGPSHTVFSAMPRRTCGPRKGGAPRAARIEVWSEQDEMRSGDYRSQKIRRAVNHPALKGGACQGGAKAPHSDRLEVDQGK